MRSLPLNKARAEFSDVFDRALAGEPQRVTRHGKEAVVVVSEAAWQSRVKIAPPLAELLAATLGAGEVDDSFADRTWASDDRPLGVEIPE